MISTFRKIEKWREKALRSLLDGDYLPEDGEGLHGVIFAYNRVLDLLVMNHPCSVCEGEKWIMQDVDSYNSSRRVHSPCRSCEGAGVCDDA